MRRKTVAEGGVGSPEVMTPRKVLAFVLYPSKELLIPAKRAKELRGELILRFNVVSHRVGIAHARHVESALVRFGPQLKVMPRKTYVLANDSLVEIAKAVAWGKRGS